MDKADDGPRGDAAPAFCNDRAANKWTARVIPVILFALIAYVSWAVTQRLSGRLLTRNMKKMPDICSQLSTEPAQWLQYSETN